MIVLSSEINPSFSSTNQTSSNFNAQSIKLAWIRNKHVSINVLRRKERIRNNAAVQSEKTLPPRSLIQVDFEEN